MKTIEGKYTSAVVYSDTAEDSALGQVQALCDQPFAKDSKIRLMPDIHAGKGCTIGTTMTFTDKICPNIVGVDIACGLYVVQLKEKRVNLPELDSCIRKNVPAGYRQIRKKTHKFARDSRIDELIGYPGDYMYCQRSLGSVGAGNHFVELDKDDEGNLYLVIHSGSRNPGSNICKWYQDKAYKRLKQKYQTVIDGIIRHYHQTGQTDRIEEEIEKYKTETAEPIYELSYVEGELFDNYLHDMKILQHYADLNRKAIAEVIMSEMNLHEVDSFTTIHNYVDVENKIIRKGAVSAQKGERLIIPMNMRDGALICVGKGNSEWNSSAPHGAGRLMSRAEARQSFTVSAYKESMEGIFTTSVGSDTIDECPMVYKPMEEIISQIQDTVEIVKVIKPIYNFKAGDELRKKVK